MGLDIDECGAAAPPLSRQIDLSRDGGLSSRSVVDRSVDVILPNGPPVAAYPADPNVLEFAFGSSFRGCAADLYHYAASTGAADDSPGYAPKF